MAKRPWLIVLMSLVCFGLMFSREITGETNFWIRPLCALLCVGVVATLWRGRWAREAQFVSSLEPLPARHEV